MGHFLHSLGRAFYNAAGKEKPLWTPLGRNLKALVDLSEWPTAIKVAMKKRDPMGDDVDDSALEVMEMWAPEEDWDVDPDQEKVGRSMILRGIRLDKLDPRLSKSLREGHALKMREKKDIDTWGPELGGIW